MAVRMKEDLILQRVIAPLDAPDNMMRMPAGLGGNLLLTDRTEALLSFPKG